MKKEVERIQLVKSPCKGCAERKIGCAIECEKWAEYQRFKEEALKARLKTYEVNKDIFGKRHLKGGNK